MPAVERGKGERGHPCLCVFWGLRSGFVCGRIGVVAARLRAETTMTMGQIAQRLKMGTRDTLSAKLQERKGTNERAKLRTDMV